MSHKNPFKTGLTALAMSAAIAYAPGSNALTVYSQDFEAMTPNQGFPPNDLSDDGWQIFGIVYDADPYTNPAAKNVGQYGPFDAANGSDGTPTGMGSIQGVATGQGGAEQGNVVLSKYSDYNNAAQADSYVAAATYQEQAITASDIGPWRFTYDAKIGNLEGNSSAFAYILTQDFATGDETFVSRDSTNLPVEWGTYSVDLMITAAMIDDNLTFGFAATSTNYEGSGVFYDNLNFAPVPIPLPGAVWLFGSGLIGLAGIARKRKAT